MFLYFIWGSSKNIFQKRDFLILNTKRRKQCRILLKSIWRGKESSKLIFCHRVIGLGYI